MSKQASMAGVAIRRQVRVVLTLGLRAGRGKMAKAALWSGLEALGFSFSEADLDGAMEWNQSRGLIDYRWNAELEFDEWFLTDRGRSHE